MENILTHVRTCVQTQKNTIYLSIFFNELSTSSPIKKVEGNKICKAYYPHKTTILYSSTHSVNHTITAIVYIYCAHIYIFLVYSSLLSSHNLYAIPTIHTHIQNFFQFAALSQQLQLIKLYTLYPHTKTCQLIAFKKK